MATVEDYHSWANRKEGRTKTDNGCISDDDKSHKKNTEWFFVNQDITHTEESSDDECIWDSTVNMYVEADTEEEEGSAVEKPQILGEEMAGHRKAICSDEAKLGNPDSLPVLRVIQGRGRTDFNATIGATTRRSTGTSNTAEEFFQIDSHGEHAPRTSCKVTLEDTQALGSSFEQIHIGDKGFHVALDKNYEMIFVTFGAGLKLIYRDKIREYVEKAMSWYIEEYASVNLPVIPKDTQYKEKSKMQTSTADTRSIRARIQKIVFEFSCIAMSSGHRPLRPAHSDNVR
ncbi:hypothetical protein B9Z19DRAFT_1124577 [Tuber borchii]|uniref:Uncharacterized protein n=1 Tax=Tuber borchii TaxID=42251 RepID=A0A2T6ZWM5_TUBBO|nr:hypothetical protein B9Z19DRAFT_1124577 [Tuber borchii]